MMDLESKAISAVATQLGRYGIEAGFVIPTATAMGKGIMDATWPLREYLARTGFHDFRTQGQGGSSKRVVPVRIIQTSGVVAGEMSMYRPETKKGDPRIWIYSLPKYASPNDLMALIVDGNQLYAVNATRENLAGLLSDASSPLGQLAARLNTHGPVAAELLKKLQAIGSQGYVPSLRAGDTGIGYTLETLLGIQANSNQAPDYHGIELKSGRMGSRKKAASARHVTLFSKIPEWEKSPYSARRALETFGYRDEKTNRLQLFCSVDAKVNSLGFKLEPRSEDDQLVNVNMNRIPGGEDVFLWVMAALRKSFADKHRETFWIGARTKNVSDVEHFHFIEARHTRNPPLSTFERLLASGGICVDLTMSEKGTSAVRDHGYLFRVYGSCFGELFPEVGVYPLAH